MDKVVAKFVMVNTFPCGMMDICPPTTTIGQLAPKTRVSLWRDKRVFFLTPQVMQNDLAKGTCPAIDVCCLVFDEAHKALGNHAYCQVRWCVRL